MHTSFVWPLVALLCACTPAPAAGDSVSTPPAVPSAAAPSAPAAVPDGTCQSISVNHITKRLPPQCLKLRPTTAQSEASEVSDATAVVPDPSAPPPSGTRTSEPDAQNNASNTPTADGQPSLNSPVSSIIASASTSEHVSSPKDTDAEADDSPLDSAKFLSFEEWKARNLAKVGQSSETFEERGAREPRRAPGSINSALDSLGEESEIEIDFGFSEKVEPTMGATATGVEPSGQPGLPRSKDAGKTFKERFNYASFDCAATVHKHNPEGKSANSILVESKEAYMLNRCDAREKFLVVELCEDILVDTVVLANFEFFSSVFKDVRISVSDRYPVKSNGWKDLGTFQARNTRDVQVFLVQNPLIWARYVKIELLSHYGNEYYCPLSLLRVHGTTMMEEFRHQEETSRGDVEDVREDIEPEAIAIEVQETIVVTPIPEERTSSSEQASTSMPVETASNDMAKSSSGNMVSSEGIPVMPCRTDISRTHYAWLKAESIFSSTALPVCSQVAETIVSEKNASERPSQSESTVPTEHKPSSSPTSQIATHIPPSVEGHEQHTSSSSDQTATTSETLTDSTTRSSEPSSPEAKPKQQPTGSPSVSQPAAATPTTQESFFKSVHKRLTALESNSSLSMQYIEDQSRILRDAFLKMQETQEGRGKRFMENLTATVEFRVQAYIDRWESKVRELESHREYSEHEMNAISMNMKLLADELIFQKRMYQINTVLLLITIGVVIFSHNDRLASPLVQHLRTRSNVRIYDSPPSSPAPILRGPHHHRRQSSGSVASYPASPSSPLVEFSPPTPPEFTSREGSPGAGVREIKSSPSTPRGYRDSGMRNWTNFGPNLRVESKGRRWQRLPSPLGSMAGDEDYDAGGEGSGEGRSSGEEIRRPLVSGTEVSGEPGDPVYRREYYVGVEYEDESSGTNSGASRRSETQQRRQTESEGAPASPTSPTSPTSPSSPPPPPSSPPPHH